jgi:hypothetical protein
MDKPNIVVTYNAIPEQQALLLKVLGGVASLTFLTELTPTQREQALEEATILLNGEQVVGMARREDYL